MAGLKKLQEVLPNRAFYGRSAVEGPSLVMTDDSTAEREDLNSTWNKTRLLLCILPMRRKNKNDGKRPHSLKLSIEQGKQNAGKW